jgi:hypothetical protein
MKYADGALDPPIQSHFHRQQIRPDLTLVKNLRRQGCYAVIRPP